MFIEVHWLNIGFTAIQGKSSFTKISFTRSTQECTTPVSIRTKNATFGGNITRFLKGVGPKIHIGGKRGEQVLSPQYHPCLISLNYVSSVSSQTRALLDLDRIYTIPEGSSLQYSIFFWGGGGGWMKDTDTCLCS